MVWLVSVEFVDATDPDRRWWRAWSEKKDRAQAVDDALSHVPTGKYEVRLVERVTVPYEVGKR